jgi:hypothetical protein
MQVEGPGTHNLGVNKMHSETHSGIPGVSFCEEQKQLIPQQSSRTKSFHRVARSFYALVSQNAHVPALTQKALYLHLPLAAQLGGTV